MNRRAGKDIWTGLYEFPLIETDHAMDFSGLCETQAFRNLLGDAGKLSITQGLSNVKHTLSHQILYASFYQIEIELVPESLGIISLCLAGILRSMPFPADTYLFREIKRKLVRMIEFVFLCMVIKNLNYVIE